MHSLPLLELELILLAPLEVQALERLVELGHCVLVSDPTEIDLEARVQHLKQLGQLFDRVVTVLDQLRDDFPHHVDLLGCHFVIETLRGQSHLF